ncbi:hypothetical protein ELY15_09675 [Legionella sp. km772]|nr:hypothetical protein ELY15_09675 [Legionella sp. km772]
MYLAENLEHSCLELNGNGLIIKNEVMRYSLVNIFPWDIHFERHLYYVFLKHIHGQVSNPFDRHVKVRLGKHLPTENEYDLLFKDPNFPIFEHLFSTYLNPEEQKKLIRLVYQELQNRGYRDELAAWENKFGNGLESPLKDNNSPDMPQLHSRQAVRAEEKKTSLFESQSAFFGAVKEKEPEESNHYWPQYSGK